ncbi:MAG: methyltransferase family protein [Inquilinaceae bacterium]
MEAFLSIRRDFPDLPPVWALGLAVAAWAAARYVPLWSFASPTGATVGIVLILAGVILAAWSALWFRRKRTTIEPRNEPSALIIEGPFRLNRNPIYTGMALVLFGVAIWLGTLSALVVVALFPAVVTRRFVKGEEEALRRAFGAEADAYFRKTRRW